MGRDGHVLALGEADQVGQLAALVVPARVVAEQVAYRVQVKGIGQPLGRFVPDDLPERIGMHCHPARIGAGTVISLAEAPQPDSRGTRSVRYPSTTGPAMPAASYPNLAITPMEIPWLPSATCAARDRASAITCRSRTAAPRAAGTPTFSAGACWSARPRAA